MERPDGGDLFQECRTQRGRSGLKAGADRPEKDTVKRRGRMPEASHLNVLVVDIGGTHVKVFATGQAQRLEFPSGPTMTAEEMVCGVKRLVTDWKYDVVSIGFPGPV